MSRITSNPVSDAFDDESEPEAAQQTFPTPPQSENNPPPKKRGGRPKGAVAASTGAKVTKAKTKRHSAEGLKAKSAAKTGKRQALKELGNQAAADGNETEEVDEFDSLSGDTPRQVGKVQQPTSKAEAEALVKKGRKPKAAEADEATAPKVEDKMDEDKPKTKRARKPAVPQTAVYEIPETQQDVAVTSKLAKTTTKNASKPPRPAKKEVPAPQLESVPVAPTEVEQMDVDDSIITAIADPDVPEERATAPSKAASRQTTRAPSKQRGPTKPSNKHQPADLDPDTDPTLSRQLHDLTTKFETLQTKYNNLRALAVSEGDSNFSKLQRASGEKDRVAERLITSLKADIERERARADAAEAETAAYRSLEGTANEVQAENRALTKSLAEAQKTIKSLQARVSATRGTSQTAEQTKSQAAGSAINGPTASKTILVGSAEAAKEAQKRVLKEELYSDLTGLILRDVKKGDEGEDVYDCIQTGRNGTLHFHLSLAPYSTSDNTTTNTSYDDAEFTYSPLLDEDRDKELLSILPDYLTEEICFPRNNAAKFYSRVCDCMTKKIE